MLNPIWLNNNGQNVIGFFPKIAFQIHYDKQNQSLILAENLRKNLSFETMSYTQKTHDNISVTALQNRLITYQQQQPTQDFENSNHYQNGFIGFISYDISADTLANNQVNANYLSQTQPLAYFGHYDIYLTCQSNHWQLHVTTQEAIEQLDTIQHWLAQIIQLKNNPSTKPLILNPIWQKSDYRQAFDNVQNYLKAGDCYQINLTQCWQGQLLEQKLADYLPTLFEATQAEFAGYLGLTTYELLSCSPELFFTFTNNERAESTIITKPIKGTRPRGTTPKLDEAYKHELSTSDKDKAENVMIVDLLRNDLGKYAKTGTVKVPKLFDIESFSNVHHMVSTITATLKDDVHPITVLFDSLPAGSITGTPKKRAVEIIHELEVKPRGSYCGTMGYLNFDGTGQWNVLIRTLQAYDNKVELWAGGGITVSSDCEAEYQECFDKVGNLLKLLQN